MCEEPESSQFHRHISLDLKRETLDYECKNTKAWLICQKPLEGGEGSLWSECSVTARSSCCGSF